MTKTSIRNNKALEKINNKLSKVLNDRCKLASCLLSPLSRIMSSQFKLVKNPNLNGVNDLLSKKPIPVTLNANFLTFRDTNGKFQLQGDLVKMVFNKNC